jgi:DnaJ-class molecular chaperone
MLAKKYHPDAIIQKAGDKPPSKEEFEEIDKKFKAITEAYGVLSDTKMRDKYNRLIFGEASDTPRDFGDQQDQYDFWASSDQSQTKRQATHRSREQQ